MISFQIEAEFQAQKKREEDARKAEVARKEQERMENMKRKEVQRITDVSYQSLCFVRIHKSDVMYLH